LHEQWPYKINVSPIKEVPQLLLRTYYPFNLRN